MLKNYWKKLKVNLQTNRKIIMADITMLEMDGYEVPNKLNKMDNFENTQVLAIMGDIYPNDIQKGLGSGFPATLQNQCMYKHK